MGTPGDSVDASTDTTTRRMRPAAGTDALRPSPPPREVRAARASGAVGLPADGAVQESAVGRTAPPGPLAPDARGAVIIPAHDESAVIARTLRALAPLTEVPGIEVIVACNGCSDDTAAIARGFPGVRVVETAQRSKPAGLNLGDSVATAWPRLYLDADIEVEPHAVLDVFQVLRHPDVLAARARFVYDTSDATGPVRAYYRARARVPAPPFRLWGAGGYATGEAGHRRFGRFAQVTADDSWFDEQFSDEEKRIVATSPMRVRTPRDVTALLAVLTRQRRGYREIGVPSQGGARVTALLRSIRGPRSALDAAWYVGLTAAASGRAARAPRTAREPAWERDDSSRRGPAGPAAARSFRGRILAFGGRGAGGRR